MSENTLVHKLFLAEQANKLAIRTISDHDILTDDFESGRKINYHIGPITTEWLQDRIAYMPSTSAYMSRYESQIVSLLKFIGPSMLINLQKIYLISCEDDISRVCEDACADEWEFPDTIDFETNDMLGCFWYQYSSIIINMTAIQKAVRELAEDAKHNGCYFNSAEEEAIGLFTTITHEIRHLGLENPFLNERIRKDKNNTEEAVEQWGLTVYENWCDVERRKQA